MDDAPATFNVLTPGIHTVNVWMREDGCIIDKIVITTDEDYDPSDIGPTGPSESPRAGSISSPFEDPDGDRVVTIIEQIVDTDPNKADEYPIVALPEPLLFYNTEKTVTYYDYATPSGNYTQSGSVPVVYPEHSLANS